MSSVEAPLLADDYLVRIRDAFHLDPITSVEFIAPGLMNRNWRITTAAPICNSSRLRRCPDPFAATPR